MSTPLPRLLQAEVDRFHQAFPNAELRGHDRDAGNRQRYRVLPILKMWNRWGEKWPWLAHRVKSLAFEDIGGSYQGETQNEGAPGTVKVRYSPEASNGTVREEFGHVVFHAGWFEDRERQKEFARKKGWGSAAWGQAFREGDRALIKFMEPYKQSEL